MENKTPSDTYWKAPLICRKVQSHNSSESQLKHNQDLFNQLGSYKNIMQFQISSRKKSR